MASYLNHFDNAVSNPLRVKKHLDSDNSTRSNRGTPEPSPACRPRITGSKSGYDDDSEADIAVVAELEELYNRRHGLWPSSCCRERPSMPAHASILGQESFSTPRIIDLRYLDEGQEVQRVGSSYTS